MPAFHATVPVHTKMPQYVISDAGCDVAAYIRTGFFLRKPELAVITREISSFSKGLPGSHPFPAVVMGSPEDRIDHFLIQH